MKGKGRSHKSNNEGNILVPYFFHYTTYLEQEKTKKQKKSSSQMLLFNIISHLFIIQMAVSKKTEDSEAKGRYQDVICLVFQCKTKESHSNGHPITGISSDLILRSFTKSVMRSENRVTTMMEEA